MVAFWSALFGGRILPRDTIQEMAWPRFDVPEERSRYGLGFWLDPSGPGVSLIGYDAGVSFRSWHNPVSSQTFTVVSNTSEGVWPVNRAWNPPQV